MPSLNIKKLATLIEINTKSESVGPGFLNDALHADQSWAASHFFAKLLLSSQQPPRPTKADLDAYIENFVKRTGIQIDIPRNWVRSWGGEIRIAYQIQNQFYRLHDYAKGQAKPAYWNDFRQIFECLSKFHQKYSSDSSLTISLEKITEIADQHRLNFPKTPGLEEFSQLNLIEKIDDRLTLNFSANNFSRILGAKIAAIIWSHLLENNPDKPNDELLADWCDLILRNDFYPVGFLSRIPNKDRERFLDAVFLQVEKEEDLQYPDQEIEKAVLDFYSPDRDRLNPATTPNFPLKGKNPLDIYIEVAAWDDIFEAFYWQPIRVELSFFISEIIHSEKEKLLTVLEGTGKSRIQQLYELAKTRPALLFTLCKIIQEKFPAVLVFFFTSADSVSLGCLLLQSIKIRDEICSDKHEEYILSAQQVITSIFQHAFELSLLQLSRLNRPTEAGKAICEILYPIAGWMFHEKQKGQEKLFSVASEFFQRQKRVLSRLMSTDSTTEFSFMNSAAALAEFADGFLKKLKNIPNSPSRNAMVRLDLQRLYLIATLWKLVSVHKKFIPDADILASVETKIKDEFVNHYRAEFSKEKIDVLNWKQNEFAKRQVEWLTEPENLNFLDWGLILELDRHSLGRILEATLPTQIDLSPDTNPPSTTDPDDEDFWKIDKDRILRSQKIRFRAHFRIVLSLYRTLSAEGVRERLGKECWVSKEEQIRQKILDWVAYNRNDEAYTNFDVFDSLLANEHISTNNPPLLQDVVQSLNCVHQERRTELIISLTKGMESLDYLLTIHNALEDTEDKKLVRNRINDVNVESFLEKQFIWKPIENALISAVNEEVFTEIAERLHTFFLIHERHKLKSLGLQPAQFLFEIELLLAYRKLDNSMMDAAKKRYLETIGKAYDEYADGRKKYFDAMFLVTERKFEEATELLLQLSKTNSSVEIHYRKMLCIVQNALLASPINAVKIGEAYQAWMLYQADEKNKNQDFSRYGEGITFLKMAWAHVREVHDEFDFYKSKLRRNTLFDPDVLRLILQNYHFRGMDKAAGRLFSEAKSFFKQLNSPRLETLDLESLQNLFNPEPYHNELSEVFRVLRSESAENVVKILPNAVNSKKNIPEFLLEEMLVVAKTLMRKITAISENQYNDLFTAFLRMRFSMIGWQIGDQSREGVSVKRKDAGEIDLVIRDGNSNNLAVYEAFIPHDNEYVQSHLKKVFTYDPVGNIFFAVVFYKKDNSKFEREFAKYENCVNETIFDDRYKLRGKFEELPDSHNLFVGKTIHGDKNAIMYHLFLNMSYSDKTSES